jgi:truncated hemoglobin YjbI
LAGTVTDHQEQSRRTGGSRVPETRRDRSLEAIQRQINALGTPRFEVGIREAKTGKMMNREWSHAEVEQSTAWLKRMNAQGNDIYIRPAGAHGLVLVDDLTADKLSSMANDGFISAATIETSPSNYQAWVKLSDQSLSPEVRKAAAQGLAQRYGGDLNSADSRHYGRLAGFTNQKPKHTTTDGRQPYVLAHDSPGMVAPAARAYLERIERWMDRVEVHEEQKTRLEAIKSVASGRKTFDPVREYQQQAQRLMARYGDGADFSRLDWMIAQDMAKSGRFTVQDIQRGIRDASPAIDSRKLGHIEDYAKRTAEKAWNSPEVENHHKQEHKQELEAKRDHGQSLG